MFALTRQLFWIAWFENLLSDWWKVEDFIREARMVMLGFYVNDPKIKNRAGQIIRNKSAHTMNQMGTVMSVNEVQTRTIQAYYEMGTRYFKRYAAMNWSIFLNTASRQRLVNLAQEAQSIDNVVRQLQQQVRMNDRRAMLELGQYLMMRVRLEKARDAVEGEMLNLIEGPYFKDRMLPDVVRGFYADYLNQQKKQQQKV
jgi:hypothetical protein